MPITYLIIGFTTLISLWAFSNQEVFYKLKHWPYAEARRGEWYRWLTGGFLHGDPTHLIFNMLTLYFFGTEVEKHFVESFPGTGEVLFLGFYLLAVVAASSATFVKHKDNPGFASIGASGATAAVLFAAILIKPTIGIAMFFIPIGIPGFIFGPLYLWFSSYEARRGVGGIDHLAHFYGALFGFFFLLALQPSLLAKCLGQIVDYF